MRFSEAFTIDPKLTLDGIMTLTAGAIAFIAVWLQIRSSRKQVEHQLDAERQARILESERQTRAVARALLFEIVNFYRYYRGHVRPLLDPLDIETCLPPTLSAPSSDFFGVYQGSANQLGSFEPLLIEKVVRSYGLSAWLLSSIREYTLSLSRELERQHSVSQSSTPRKLLKQIKALMYETDGAAVAAMQELCKIASVPFDSFKSMG